MQEDIAVKVDEVNKTFKLPHEKQTSIKGALINRFKGGRRSYEKQEVLKNISFEIKKGEFFGIVGRNGSGKSTLLKMLAGIYTPTKGAIHVNGKLTPFIELGVGFNPELTGRENVFLNGALLGFNRKEMSAMYDDIVTFAELEKFMDQKLKNYSSGMQVRLAFSIAIRARSDILLLDEVLAVGDAAFQRKCFNYFADLKNNKQTVIFISHDMESVRRYCDRAIFIEKGVIQEEGEPEKVIKKFTKLFVDAAMRQSDGGDSLDDLPIGMNPSSGIDTSVLQIGRVWLEGDGGKKIQNLSDEDKDLCIKFEISPLAKVDKYVPGIIIRDIYGEMVVAVNANWAKSRSSEPGLDKKKVVVTFKVPNIFEQGDYTVSVNVVSHDYANFYAWKNESLSFYAERKHQTGAKTYPQSEVTYTV